MTLRILFLVAMISLAASFARAQFEFEEPEAAPAGEAPAAADAETAPPATPENTAALEDLALRDPLVAAVVELPRDTPARKLTAVIALIDLGHADVAGLVLPDLLATELDDAQRAALVRQFGPARFMELIRLDTPAAAGVGASPLAGARDFAQKCLDAAAAEATDPARIAKIIQQLNAPGEEDRYAARVDLRSLGRPGIEAAISALATAAAPAARANIMAALADMRPTVDAPLVAVLAEGRGQVRADAATLAGRLRIRASLPWLSALSVSGGEPAVANAAAAALSHLGLPQPTPAEVHALLRRELAALDSAPLTPDDVPQTWWSWDAAANQLVAVEQSPRQRRVLARARLAEALAESGGVADPAARRLVLIDALEAAPLRGGPMPASLQQLLTTAAAADVSATLAAAVERQLFTAAARLAAELGARGDASVLSTPDGRPSPLAAALASPVRELRFAALQAVMQLNPTYTFPGASHVPTALWYFAVGGGEPAAVVASPIFTQATDWAGQLRALGYETMPAATGRGALIAAFDRAASTRLALVMLDSDIGQPLVREVVFQLHSADRTAGVPIVIASSTGRFEAAERIAAYDPLVLAAPRPHGEGALAELVDRGLALSPHPLADKAVRLEQAAQALDWIATLLANGGPYDELRRDGGLVNRTLFAPELAEASLRVLVGLGTADSQSALADYASSPSLPIDARRSAAAALAESFQRFGIQLTTAQILRQYDRYNASETADAETQQVLGGILDAIEKK